MSEKKSLDDHALRMDLPKANQTMEMSNGVYVPDRRLTGDEKLREEHPGLKELWEKYQAMLKLVKPAEEPRLANTAGDVLAQIRQRMNKPSVGIRAAPEPPRKKKLQGTAKERIDQIKEIFSEGNNDEVD